MTSKLKTTSRSDNIQSVQLTLDILELLADSPQPLGVTEIAKHLGVSKSRAFRHLRMLYQRGYAYQDSVTEKYQAGVSLFTMCHMLFTSNGWFKLVKPMMGPLANKLDLTVTLTRIENNELLVIDVSASNKSICFAIPIGYSMDSHATAHGKVALAFGEPSFSEAVLSKPLRALTPETIVDLEVLNVELATVKKQGWAISYDECVPGMTTIAAPIITPGGYAVGGLGLIGPSQSIGKVPTDAHLNALLSVTHLVSERLGGFSDK